MKTGTANECWVNVFDIDGHVLSNFYSHPDGNKDERLEWRLDGVAQLIQRPLYRLHVTLKLEAGYVI